MLPLGEGFDELPHLGYIQYVAQARTLPRPNNAYPSQEIEFFLTHHPAGWSVYRDPRFTVTSYEGYWQSSQERRAEIDFSVRNIRFTESFFSHVPPAQYPDENHQPPLYYLLSAPIFAVASRYLSFVGTFVILRLWTVLLASLLIPGTFLLAKHAIKDEAARETVVALVVLFPGLYPAVARISNDALAVPLASWLMFCLVAFIKTEKPVYLRGLALLLVAGLWTKAFFVPIGLGVFLTMIACRKFRPALTVLLISTIGLPWYAFNFMHSGSVTGLPEAVSANSSITTSLAALTSMDWGNVWRVARSSHIWIGNSSLLVIRTWMYQVVSWLFIFASAGVLIRVRQASERSLHLLILNYIVFCASLIYYATQVFLVTGIAYCNGWYLASFIPVEALLFVAGVQTWTGKRWRWPAAVMLVFLFVLFVYTTAFVEIPYYSGMTAHVESGNVNAYQPHLRDFPVMTARLLRLFAPMPLFVPWVLMGFFGVFAIDRIVQLMRRIPDTEA